MTSFHSSAGKLLCIYHGNCADGFAAAWVVRKFFGDGEVDFHPGVYQNPPPPVAGRDVIIVDFSYKRPVMEKLIDDAKTVLVLDHHKTAEAELEGLLERDYDEPFRSVQIIFDMDRSGAMITWDYFFPGENPPQLLRHIQDRDLWQFKLENTREIQAAVFSYPYDFEVWDGLMNSSPEELAALTREGAAIERKHFKDIDELVGVATVPVKLLNHVVPAANLPYTLASDAGHQLATRENWDGTTCPPPAFGATYWIGPEGVTFSLRSHGDFDVSAVAKAYGGGGHKNAAGFRVSLSDFKRMTNIT